jgi:hypothetical protein
LDSLCHAAPPQGDHLPSSATDTASVARPATNGSTAIRQKAQPIGRTGLVGHIHLRTKRLSLCRSSDNSMKFFTIFSEALIVARSFSAGDLMRQENVGDRRTYALHLTDEGQAILGEIGRTAEERQDLLLTSLGKEEREQLADLLQRIADDQGLTPGVHPGFSRIGKKGRPKF